jgi:glutathione-regulated potassium-efflux system ancillary protein KefG
VGRKVDVDDLLDANGVAELLGFAHRNTVSVYQHRYANMPRPVREFGDRRAKLWLRSEIEGWRADRQRSAEQSPTTDLDANGS